MRVVINGTDYVPVGKTETSALLARLLVAEWWGWPVDDDRLVQCMDDLFVSVTDSPGNKWSDEDRDTHRLGAVVARMLDRLLPLAEEPKS